MLLSRPTFCPHPALTRAVCKRVPCQQLAINTALGGALIPLGETEKAEKVKGLETLVATAKRLNRMAHLEASGNESNPSQACELHRKNMQTINPRAGRRYFQTKGKRCRPHCPTAQ